MKAIVVGAGLAGLTAGYKLKQAGWEVTVLEAGNYAGGRAATVRDGDYLIDTAATQLSGSYRRPTASSMRETTSPVPDKIRQSTMASWPRKTYATI